MNLNNKNNISLENQYAIMESEILVSPGKLLKGLRMKDNIEINPNLSVEQTRDSLIKLMEQRKLNLVLVRNFVAEDQRHFFATGQVNMQLRQAFEDICISDSFVITRRLKELERFTLEPEYSESVLWDYFNDLSRVKRHAFCVSGTLDQIDDLVLLNLRARKNGDILQNGACYFPTKLYEAFFTNVKAGNNVVVL